MDTQTLTERESPASPGPGFESLDTEVNDVALQVTGSLPDWLSGSLIRNGPGLFEAGDRPLRHWFDGQAMLHRFAVKAGAVTYGNRFLRTRAYQAAKDGRLAYSEFATDPCRSIFKRLMTVFDPAVTDNTAVSVTKLGQQHLAMTEAPISVEFDPDTLETLGYGPKAPGTFATAHPHHDPASGALVNQATRLGLRSSYRFFVQEPGRPARVLATKTVREPGYVHSFAMSERYIALLEFPFIVNPITIPTSGKPFIENFRWEPERGTRILVFDRNSGEEVGVLETDAGFAFHHIGAWDEGGSLVMDFCDHGSPAIVDAFYLDRLRAGRTGGNACKPARPRRLRVDIGTGKVSSEFLSDQDLELPRINDQQRYLQRYRYVYGIARSAEDPYDA
ncbi:MAG TPA: carotenoid oxygenase family protein, partial [Solirubrobacterales bacterium]|nr:carotenoid oxygenase family protein [Solirubrobacterales bacterium]